MAILSTLKKVGGAVKDIFTGGTANNANAISALQSKVTPNQTLMPNISTPQGIGQTQKDGSITLLNKQGVPTGSVIGASGVGSTPLPSQPNSPYYVPPTSTAKSTPTTTFPVGGSGGGISSSGGSKSSRPLTDTEIYLSTLAPGSTLSEAPTAAPASQGNVLRNAFDALKRAAGNVKDFAVDAITQPRNPNLGLLDQSGLQNQSSVPIVDPSKGVTATVATEAPTSQTGTGKISDQYKVIAQDKTSDSTTLKRNIDAVKQQEDAAKQTQIQGIQAALEQKYAQLAALQSQQVPPVDGQTQEGLPSTYSPDSNPAISSLSAEIAKMEEEIARVMQDSPELQAATEALNAKIAEEAAIKSRLVQGQTNIAEQPIAYSFIGGQQEALQRRANADLQTNASQQIPLQQRLATEQASSGS